mmetsp:Transcript_27011/g.68700  ORF Transcript_27011/g.68700 Transcript_27011/m.68700 type:complete len:135 (-) Transcript_27011:633-1037(-)|eukprot:CAMPEP_0202857650 /NCGR_PEP_ID=MMETSP1391-20130828/508_1 /ASSEMBLY_ACC=CAM_ASM_000867 /TAXON_ID=1034604 /ORGANISM="Chlamydomonas leiostraca, Strain SAG 11-49" /LENGTH=134 /DNA_ID=CAMNT_0049536475 /DNA_START=147 /DNA_END=551 /DNA_ORIENTATION=+
MNQPDRYSRFVLADGVSKVSYKADTKLAHAGTLTIMQEDHTLGNLLRMQLFQDKHVVFAGYRIPHPLEPRMVVKVQTTGVKQPTQAVEHALEDLRSEVQTLIGELDEGFRAARSAGGMGMGMGMGAGPMGMSLG